MARDHRNARRSARPDWGRIARALAAGFLVLPLVVFLDVQLVRGVHALLSLVFPGALSLYLVGTYALLLAFLLAATYAAVPLLAMRPRPVTKEERDG